MLPNFLVVGTQKGGTTSFHNYLSQHPEIFVPDGKETKFFVMNERYSKGIESYKKYFENVRDEQAIGEVDPDYMYFNVALERISKHLDVKKLKIIFILRNPTDRAFSHYLMTFRRGIEQFSFKKALSKEKDRIVKDFNSEMHFSYEDRGYYLKQIKRFEKYIDKDRMHFILTDELKLDANKVMHDVFDFLNVNSYFNELNTSTTHHKAKVPRSKKLLSLIVNRNNGVIKKCFRLLLPSKNIRHKLRARIIKANERGSNMTIDENSKKYLNDKYILDNQELQTYIAKSLVHWCG